MSKSDVRNGRGPVCQHDLGRIGSLAQLGEEIAGVRQGQMRSVLGEIVRNTDGELVEVDNAHYGVIFCGSYNASCFDADARRVYYLSDATGTLDPGFDAKGQRDDERGRSRFGHHQHRFGPIGYESCQPRHRRRPGVVGVDENGVELRRGHRSAQPREPCVEHGIGQFRKRARDEAAAHGSSHTGISNNSRGVRHNTSTPVSVTTTASPSTM